MLGCDIWRNLNKGKYQKDVLKWIMLVVNQEEKFQISDVTECINMGSIHRFCGVL